MKDFDIVKYLKEHQLGSYGILNHYVDLKPLKEVEDEIELEKTIPYEGPEHQLTGNGGGDEFEQAETISEDVEDYTALEACIKNLISNGMDEEQILSLVNKILNTSELPPMF